MPGSAIPSASVMQFIELAVYIPEQEPQVGQASSSYCFSSASENLPALTLPTASKTALRSTTLSPTRPASIGPPLMTMAGKSRRAAAINMAGTILSQLGTSTNPSSACAMAMVSILSAISSRLARE